ncbi:hypothetical protein HK098_004818 [Nowakowskiella sp. JEL0407]|nr:hypothetical protein HK098_004818 [Nowakowskiella sp. JEL0407]
MNSLKVLPTNSPVSSLDDTDTLFDPLYEARASSPKPQSPTKVIYSTAASIATSITKLSLHTLHNSLFFAAKHPTAETIRQNFLFTLLKYGGKSLSITLSLLEVFDDKVMELTKNSSGTASHFAETDRAGKPPMKKFWIEWINDLKNTLHEQFRSDVFKSFLLNDIEYITDALDFSSVKRCETPAIDLSFAESKDGLIKTVVESERVPYDCLKDLKLLNNIGMFPEKLSFSFCGYNDSNIKISGAPWLGMYDLGAAEYLLGTLNPSILPETQLVVSGSGIFAALAITFQIPIPKIEEKLFELNSHARKFGGVGNMSKFVRRALEELMTGVADREVWLSGDMVVVSVTEFPTMKNVLISRFFTKREMIDTFMASLNIPIYYETQIKLKHSKNHLVPINQPKESGYEHNTAFSHICGSFSNRVPTLSKYTIKILPPATTQTQIDLSRKSLSETSLNVQSDPLQVSRFDTVKDSELLNVSIAGYNFMKDVISRLVGNGTFSAEFLKDPSKFKVNPVDHKLSAVLDSTPVSSDGQKAEDNENGRWSVTSAVGKVLYSPLKVLGF